MSVPVIGIDLGTTNSVVAYADESGTVTVIADENGDRIIPSVVHFEPNGNIVVGRYAREYLKIEPQRVARIFKRGMGTPTFLPGGQPFVVDGRTLVPEELSALVLLKLRKMAEAHFGEPVTDAVITVPHYFGEPERAATRSAGEIIGLNVLQIVNEPTAAAIAHGHSGEAEEGTLLVFDLGGGTFDVTVMRNGAGGEMEVIATGGDRELGGTDFDEAIVSWMAEQARGIGAELGNRAEVAEPAEQMKMEVSARDEAKRSLSFDGKPLIAALTRDEFERLIADQARLVEDAVLGTLDKLDLEGPEVTATLMVGGSSRIPMFQTMVEKIVGKKPELTKNLDEDVARGAALLGAKLGDTLDPRSELALRPNPVDAASHALGLTLVHPEDHSRLINEVVIPEGTPIPHASSHDLMTVDDGQTTVKLELNEGADQDLDFTRRLDESVGHFGRPVPKEHPLRCAIEYTADQLIKVHLYDGLSGQLLTELEVAHKGMLSEEQRDAAREYLRRAGVG
jgi:molecular chaperone DnaK